MSLLLLWVFQLKVSVCVVNFPFSILPYTNEQRVDICIDRILRDEQTK